MNRIHDAFKNKKHGSSALYAHLLRQWVGGTWGHNLETKNKLHEDLNDHQVMEHARMFMD